MMKTEESWSCMFMNVFFLRDSELIRCGMEADPRVTINMSGQILVGCTKCVRSNYEARQTTRYKMMEKVTDIVHIKYSARNNYHWGGD